jgi:hypothetical protein
MIGLIQSLYLVSGFGVDLAFQTYADEFRTTTSLLLFSPAS